MEIPWPTRVISSAGKFIIDIPGHLEEIAYINDGGFYSVISY
jgi:hypothetical protein